MLIALLLLVASPDDCSGATPRFLIPPLPLQADLVTEAEPEPPTVSPAFALDAGDEMPPELRRAVQLRDAAQYAEAVRLLQSFAKQSPDAELGVEAAHDASLILMALGYSDSGIGEAPTRTLIEAWNAACPWTTSTAGCFEWEGPRNELQPGLRFACGAPPVPPVLLPRRGSTETRWRAEAVLHGYTIDRTSVSRSDAAEAAFILADLELERLLELRAPRGLDFTVEEWRHDSGFPEWESLYRAQLRAKSESVCAYRRYYEKLVDAEHRTQDAFRRVLELRVPRWSVAAASRLGGLYETYRARTNEAVVGHVEPATDRWEKTFCHPDLNDPFQSQAVDIYRACIEVAEVHLVHSPYVRACELGLGRLSEHALSHEVLDPAGELGFTTGSTSLRVHALGAVEG